MISRKIVGEIIQLYVICVFFVNITSTACVNGSASFKDVVINSTEEILPDIPVERFRNKYYYFGAIYDGNYFQAMQYCNFNGMTLLSIETIEENNFLWEKLKSFLGHGEYHFWTSGTTLASPHWVWLTTGRPILYANWFPNQPDNAGNNEKCLEVRYSSDNKALMWNDHVCTVAKHVICETAEVKCVSKLIVEKIPAV